MFHKHKDDVRFVKFCCHCSDHRAYWQSRFTLEDVASHCSFSGGRQREKEEKKPKPFLNLIAALESKKDNLMRRGPS